MPISATGKTSTILPGQSKQPASGKTKTEARPEPPVAPGKKSRRVKAREDVDSDYAEEAEDFFYGEGM